MTTLELRDPVAGVLARSARREDCIKFLHECITRKYADIADLDGIDPFTAAVMSAEIERLRTICGLLDGTIAYVNVDDEEEDEATPVGSSAAGDTPST
jgi:hypothetical protein